MGIPHQISRTNTNQLKNLNEQNKDVGAMATMLERQRRESDHSIQTLRQSDLFPQRALQIHLKSATNLPNLDFGTINVMTGGIAGGAANLIGSKAIQDLSDPY